MRGPGALSDSRRHKRDGCGGWAPLPPPPSPRVCRVHRAQALAHRAANNTVVARSVVEGRLPFPSVWGRHTCPPRRQPPARHTNSHPAPQAQTLPNDECGPWAPSVREPGALRVGPGALSSWAAPVHVGAADLGVEIPGVGVVAASILAHVRIHGPLIAGGRRHDTLVVGSERVGAPIDVVRAEGRKGHRIRLVGTIGGIAPGSCHARKGHAAL